MKIYENSEILSFLDINPANKGHTLVVTKKHYETLLDIPDSEFIILAKSVKRIAEAITKGMNVDGFNLLMNNKKISGQEVPHAHFHVIPRFENDGIEIKWQFRKYNNGEMNSLLEKIRKYI